MCVCVAAVALPVLDTVKISCSAGAMLSSCGVRVLSSLLSFLHFAPVLKGIRIRFNLLLVVCFCAVQILRAEGPLAFYQGFPTYYVRIAPHAMITLISMETLNGFYKSYTAK